MAESFFSFFFEHVKFGAISWNNDILGNNHLIWIGPFHNTSAPARLHLPVPHVLTKPLKSSLSLPAKILFPSKMSELSTATGIIMK